MTKKPSGFKPGETVPQSGLYQQIGPRSGKGPEVTSVKGEPPPWGTRQRDHVQARGTRATQVRALKRGARQAGFKPGLSAFETLASRRELALPSRHDSRIDIAQVLLGQQSI